MIRRAQADEDAGVAPPTNDELRDILDWHVLEWDDYPYLSSATIVVNGELSAMRRAFNQLRELASCGSGHATLVEESENPPLRNLGPPDAQV